MQKSDQNNKTILVILDGWGLGPYPDRSAIHLAHTPNIDFLLQNYPNAKLITHGEAVGLPEGQMGNSEVGHLNIGAGRVVYQDLVKINKAIREGQLDEQGKLKSLLDYAERENKAVHLIGLCSDGGVHSHIDHLYGILDFLNRNYDGKTFIHAITDGRDTDPRSGLQIIREINKRSSSSKKFELATVIGRYYAMDRDRRWERTKVAYDALVRKIGTFTDDPAAYVREQYEKGITDEFILPGIARNSAFKGIQDGDVVFFFNFRTDRPRQLTIALTQKEFPEQGMSPLDLKFLSMTNYDPEFKNIEVLFDKENLKNTLGEVISKKGLTQLRIAETEKYPHVTFFFSGGREVPFDGEDRILINSPKVATYDLEPEMSAREVTQALIEAISQSTPDFICLNYANADMVGHTGDLKAAIKAVETVDKCLGQLIPVCKESGIEMLIIADHGNSDLMINENGTPNTAHTINPVPVIYIGKNSEKVVMKDGVLADIAPTILALMGLEIPTTMTGKKLID